MYKPKEGEFMTDSELPQEPNKELQSWEEEKLLEERMMESGSYEWNDRVIGGVIKRYSYLDLKRNMDLFRTAKPFYVTLDNVVVAEVTDPGGSYYVCENCHSNTKNLIQFQNKTNEKWERLVLCDHCKSRLLS